MNNFDSGSGVLDNSLQEPGDTQANQNVKDVAEKNNGYDNENDNENDYENDECETHDHGHYQSAS